MIGLERDVVKLRPYTAEWARLFAEEEERIRGAIGEYVLDIQHVGSTAIPGMAAKPILDIAVAVASFEEAFVCVAPMEHIGYEYCGENGIPRRHYFVKRSPLTTHHVHINERGSRNWENQVIFRDYMSAHPQAIEAYIALKEGLAKQFPRDREAYTNGKAQFIEHILDLARKDYPPL
jgi:GrpB-like predicted nucleotidyltransferase (UPF0157 family)